MIKIKRVYDTPADRDGVRILIDRLWPRGLKRDLARIDYWLKDIAPSPELRSWFGHSAERWSEFQLRYRMELNASPAAVEVARVCALAEKQPVTLLFGARDLKINHAVVLLRWIEVKHPASAR